MLVLWLREILFISGSSYRELLFISYKYLRNRVISGRLLEYVHMECLTVRGDIHALLCSCRALSKLLTRACNIRIPLIHFHPILRCADLERLVLPAHELYDRNARPIKSWNNLCPRLFLLFLSVLLLHYFQREMYLVALYHVRIHVSKRGVNVSVYRYINDTFTRILSCLKFYYRNGLNFRIARKLRM